MRDDKKENSFPLHKMKKPNNSPDFLEVDPFFNLVFERIIAFKIIQQALHEGDPDHSIFSIGLAYADNGGRQGRPAGIDSQETCE